jgi:hypothetical protein
VRGVGQAVLPHGTCCREPAKGLLWQPGQEFKQWGAWDKGYCHKLLRESGRWGCCGEWHGRLHAGSSVGGAWGVLPSAVKFTETTYAAEGGLLREGKHIGLHVVGVGGKGVLLQSDRESGRGCCCCAGRDVGAGSSARGGVPVRHGAGLPRQLGKESGTGGAAVGGQCSQVINSGLPIVHACSSFNHYVVDSTA